MARMSEREESMNNNGGDNGQFPGQPDFSKNNHYRQNDHNGENLHWNGQGGVNHPAQTHSHYAGQPNQQGPAGQGQQGQPSDVGRTQSMPPVGGSADATSAQSQPGFGSGMAAGMAGGQGPQGPQGPQSPQGPQGYPAGGQTATAPRRWSTPAVAALLLAGAVLASGTTYVAMDQFGGSSNTVTSSFNSAPEQGKNTENTSNPPQPGTVSAVADKVLPSVVSINVTTARGGGEGSGSIISSDGLIMTNNHVIAGADQPGGKIEVMLNDGRALPAKVVAADPQTDIAVIKAEGANDLKPITFGNSNDVQVGENVVAIGSPLGLSSTVTTGIVSTKNRPVQATGEQGGEASLIDAIQTDASINPGNSGGALVNMKGELIGIPSVIATTGGSGSDTGGSIGLGFAIPIDQAERIAKQLIDTGKVQHPIIGAKINTQANVLGAQIVEVNPGSPAEKAGLKPGEIVTRVDDRRVESGVGLIAAIRSHAVGDKVSLTVVNANGGDEHNVDVTLTASD